MSQVKTKLMQGNEACAAGALAAGVCFFAGYPITPSTEIAEQMALHLPRVGGKFIQMEDEIGAMAAVIGASIAGAKALTATSGPGFSLKQENLGYAALTEIPCVVVDVQRLGPSTGNPTAPSQGDVMQARWGTHGDHPIVAFSPSSVKEAFELTVKAVNVSEKYRTPVVLLLDEIVGHMRENVSLPDKVEVVERMKPANRENYLPYKLDQEVTPLIPFGEGEYYHITGLFHDESGFPNLVPELVTKKMDRLMAKINNHKDDLIITDEYALEDAEVVVFTYGASSRSARRAVKEARAQGLRVGMLRTATIWPFPEEKVKAVAEQAKAIVVPEMNMGQLIYEVERVAKGEADVVGVNRYNGEIITPEEILQKVKGLMNGATN
ncbi:MAG: 2-oxoacid:acceptor oxidoreductase subunit alpha [Dethiobacteria bacterium]|jgi:2-oxoglutarate ferredoxin oxidoreductase subunit alpha|nr:2-oxoacid:acceptor oxidoreductase subunit alpha [Bacillota bacterium]